MSVTTAAPRNRWITGFVLLLLLATAVLVIGVVAEQAPSDTDAGAPPTASFASAAGEADETGGEADDGEVILGPGADAESTPAVGAAVLLALLLAAAVWWRANRVTVTLAAVYCMGAAALDTREVAHQLVESQARLATMVTGVMLLHLVALVVALEAFDACRHPAPAESASAAWG
jgi:hypothetical protein